MGFDFEIEVTADRSRRGCRENNSSLAKPLA
ncbi:MAG: hypothetical protein ACI8XO_004470, partial [Verrucomicrobiales bacterium]